MEEKILEWLAANPNSTMGQIGSAIGTISPTAIFRTMGRLLEEKKVSCKTVNEYQGYPITVTLWSVKAGD